MLTALTITDLSALLSIASARALLEARDECDATYGLDAESLPEWQRLNAELATRVGQLSDAAQMEFIALVWLGRSDVGWQSWQSLLGQASKVRNSRITMAALLADCGLDGQLRTALDYLASPTVMHIQRRRK